MKYVLHSFRHADVILSQSEFVSERNNLLETISSTTDDEVIECFESKKLKRGDSKSVSQSINHLLKHKLKASGWRSEPNIFQDSEYAGGKNWRLDFARNLVSVEVAFNHGGNTAWNLIKPVLAGELNHVQKDIQTRIGVVICATESMKISGGFDKAVGSYENFIKYLNPLRNFLTVPILLVGLSPFETFRIVHHKSAGKTRGFVRKLV